MAKAINNSQEKQQYEVLKECWLNGSRYLPTQLVKLTEPEAKEWLDRKCIKLAKKTTTPQNNKPEENK